MESILCLVHTEADGSLAKPAREALAVAKDLSTQLGGAPFDLGLVGADVAAAANAVAAGVPCQNPYTHQIRHFRNRRSNVSPECDQRGSRLVSDS